ncbi:Scavenger receptor cysteine-rich type 1 M130 [Paramuricea clavata]|uniref:Scavenger receptor cysteine-rich type 1 M130 n=1 Tax=Paramuricea clavata TaxID=317549 RepID=A0A6S7KYQ8_PARCT|nr:Scavenger receptor cysteine-rich type 1 M130 [Paramuricea clavata]
MKAKEDFESAEKNISPPRQAHAAPTSGMENVNDDVAATTSKNRAKEVVVIAGDSLIKNVVVASMSKTDPNHYYVVKAFPGANLSDKEDFIKPITRKSPEKIILHVGTNDLKNSPAKVIADSLLNLTTQIKEDSPTTVVGISALLTRNDNANLATKVKQVNFILDNYCRMNKNHS